MKTIRFVSLIFIITLCCAVIGCASQKSAAPTPAPTPPSNPKPLTAEDKQKAELEAMLEEDNWDELEQQEKEQDISGANLPVVNDSIEYFNRAMFYFNDKLYFWVLKPVATGYKAVVPQKARTGVNNFFHNLLAPLRMVNCLFQGKGQDAEAEFARFLYNTTVGVFGFGNPAKKHSKLNPPQEDFGQTLARYGVGEGFYLVLPLLGPTTLRDAVGKVGDTFLTPSSYVEPMEARLAIYGYKEINYWSFHIGDYEALKDSALDPYEAARNIYLQYRRTEVKK